MFRSILKKISVDPEAVAEPDQAGGTAVAEAPGNTVEPGSVDPDELQDKIVDAIRTVYDPEIHVNIYDLGLIYGVFVNSEGDVSIRMTLTSPNCPEAQSLPASVENKAKSVPGTREVMVSVVWDPPWDQTKMSEAARLQLNMF